jgi:hypothetical protein
MVAQTPYCFADEIEVYRGKDAWLTEPPAGTPVDSAEGFFRQTKTVGGIRWRLQSDLATVRAAIGDLPLEPTLARAEELAAEIDALPKDVPEGFRTTLPLNRLHADIYSLNATVLRTRGFRGLSAWKADRWAPLQPLDSPEAPTEDVPSLRVELMRGEVRGTAVNLLNATDEAQDVTIEIQGFPAALSIRVLDVVFTDTRSRIPIAAALSDPRHTAEGPFVTVSAGCCKQVWLSVERPARPLEGEHQGTVRLKHGEWLAEMPLTISVADLSFPQQPTMSFGGWDYTNGNAGYYKAPGNVTQLVPMLREYYVDTPWATVAVAPKGAEFDEGGALTNPDRLDFANWDEWVERWSGVRNYYVFLSYKDSFHGEEMGTPRFNRMVGQYFTAWVEHMTEQGLEPHQLGVLILDEPHDNAQDEIIVAYAKAIRAAQPEIDIFEDPTYRDPTKGVPAMFETSTTLCPNTPMMIAQGGAFREFYEAQRKGGRRLWLYSCSGPAKLLDPLNYHRGQMWWAMRIGATGTFYWALGCGGGIGDSWNAYAQTGVEYAPFFVSPASVTRGKHMEAIREGIQDYEYYVMLRARVRALAARGVPEAKLARARKMLAELPVQVTDAIDSGSLTWSAPKDRGLMDRTRLELLRELVALQ